MREIQDFITRFDETNRSYTKDKLVKEFLDLAKNRHEKHFWQWNDVFFFALAGDSLPATHIAKWLLGKNYIPNDPEFSYASSKHKTTINLKDLISFLTKNIKNVKIMLHPNGMYKTLTQSRKCRKGRVCGKQEMTI